MPVLMRRSLGLGFFAVSLVDRAGSGVASDERGTGAGSCMVAGEIRRSGCHAAEPRRAWSCGGTTGPCRRNSRDGNPLKIGDTQFKHGLYCHANSRIRVCLPGPAKSFVCSGRALTTTARGPAAAWSSRSSSAERRSASRTSAFAARRRGR